MSEPADDSLRGAAQSVGPDRSQIPRAMDTGALPTIRVEQAVYGERGGAHSLLAHSTGTAPFSALTGYTDLPSAAPPGIKWQPFETVFAYTESLVLARTFPDPASSRTGMVVTHALILPRDAVIVMRDLEGIGSLLPVEPTKPAEPGRANLPVLSFTPAETSEPSYQHGNAWTVAPADLEPPTGGSRHAALARALLAQGSDRPVVWVGQSGFWKAACLVWRSLWPAARSRFAVRLSFGPMDVAGQSLTIVTTPSELVGRWSGGFALVPREVSEQIPLSKAEALLIGNGQGDDLSAFVAEFGSGPERIHDLSLMEPALAYARLANRTADEDRAFARLLARIAPSPQSGEAMKRAAVTGLVNATRTGTAGDVLALANFGDAADALPDGEMVFDAVREWVAGRIVRLSLGPELDEVLRVLLRAIATAEGAPIPTRPAGSSAPMATREATGTRWAAAVRDGVTTVLGYLMSSATSSDVAAALWAWWRAAPQLVGSPELALPNASSLDQIIADAAPMQMSEDLGAAVRAFARSRGWMRLHAAAASATLPAGDAFRAQLAVDRRSDSVEALGFLAGRVSTAALVQVAVSDPDPRLATLAGSAIAREPTLLAPIDPTIPGWRRVWAAALEAGAPAWRGIPDPVSVAAALADATLAAHAAADGFGGEAEFEILWRALARETATDLAAYPHRPTLWSALSRESRDALVGRTAEHWLTNFGSLSTESGEHTRAVAAAEPELLAAIGDTRRFRIAAEGWLARGDAGIGAVVALFAGVGTLNESQLKWWVAQAAVAPGQIPVASAHALGALVSARRWRNVASELAQTSRAHSDFHPAIQECRSLLDVFTRLGLTLHGVSTSPDDDAWEGLEAAARDLYHTGPMHSHLWERAGGAADELLANGSGREQWADALRRLRRGGTHVNASTLLQKMRDDFPNNVRLATLAQHPLFRDRMPHRSEDGERHHRWWF